MEYLPDPAVAVAAAYTNLNPMYTTSPYATAADNIYMGGTVHSTNFYPVTENLFHQYRLQGVGGYYTDYHHTNTPHSAYVANVTNGFISYDSYALPSKEDKWQDSAKYYSGYSSGYASPISTPQVSNYIVICAFLFLVTSSSPIFNMKLIIYLGKNEASSFKNAKIFSTHNGGGFVFFECFITNY